MRKFCFWLLVASSCIVGCARDGANPKAVRLTAAQLDGYAGQFQDKKNPDQTLNFYRTGDHLTVETERRPPTELKTLSATEFTDADSSISAWFTWVPMEEPLPSGPLRRRTQLCTRAWANR